MKAKWTVLIIFIFLFCLGIIGAGWHTYDATDPAKASKLVEMLKVVFIMVGGLGVILPTYLNVWQSFETAKLQEDQSKRNIIENTFKLLEKWDDRALLEARKYSRAMRDEQQNLSPVEIVRKVTESEHLRQSVILLFNYFEQVRVSINNDRIDNEIFKQTLGSAMIDIYERFKPWILEQPNGYQVDLEQVIGYMRD